MKSFLVFAVCLIISGLTAAMADQPTTADLDKFGRWLYRQQNTDLDLCVQWQDSTHATAADSAKILRQVQALTVPRRVANHTAWISNFQKETAERQNQLLLTYCKPELDTLTAGIQRITTVQGQEKAAEYRREGLKKLIPLAAERAMAAPIEPLRKAFQDLAGRVEKVERNQTVTADSLNAMRGRFGDLATAFNQHVGLRIKQAHSR